MRESSFYDNAAELGGPISSGHYSSNSGNSASGTLELRVIEATDLVERRKERKQRSFFAGMTDSNGESSRGEYAWPFVTIRAGQDPARRTMPGVLPLGSEAGNNSSSSSGGGIVMWHEDFVFEGVKASQQVVVTCFMHRQSSGSDGSGTTCSVVGEVQIPVGRLPEAHPIEQWYQLTSSSGGGGGGGK